MNQYYIIRKIFKEHDGLVFASDFEGQSVQWNYLNMLVRMGSISKIRRGVYQWREYGGLLDFSSSKEYEILFKLFPEAIVCMKSALYFYGYLNLKPKFWDLAFDRDMNKRRLKINYPAIKPYFIESYLLDIGLSEELFSSCGLKIYDRERTICDLLRRSSKIDREILNKAIQAYVSDGKKNIPNLIQYSKDLRVYAKVQQWITVWL